MTVVRNPYDRMVSEYFHLRQSMDIHPVLGNISKMNFNKFISVAFGKYDELKEFKSNTNDFFVHFLPQINFLTINNKIVMDKIYYFENIEELENDMGKLDHLGKSIHREYKDYMKYYNKESIEIINKFYDLDFKNFNYKKVYE